MNFLLYLDFITFFFPSQSLERIFLKSLLMESSGVHTHETLGVSIKLPNVSSLLMLNHTHSQNLVKITPRCLLSSWPSELLLEEVDHTYN
jgi:hypothetical protein